MTDGVGSRWRVYRIARREPV
ncbi:hypothetical protein LCGC14_2399810, partial [marine sediment metagenome]